MTTTPTSMHRLRSSRQSAAPPPVVAGPSRSVARRGKPRSRRRVFIDDNASNPSTGTPNSAGTPIDLSVASSGVSESLLGAGDNESFEEEEDEEIGNVDDDDDDEDWTPGSATMVTNSSIGSGRRRGGATASMTLSSRRKSMNSTGGRRG